MLEKPQIHQCLFIDAVVFLPLSGSHTDPNQIYTPISPCNPLGTIFRGPLRVIVLIPFNVSFQHINVTVSCFTVNFNLIIISSLAPLDGIWPPPLLQQFVIIGRKQYQYLVSNPENLLLSLAIVQPLVSDLVFPQLHLSHLHRRIQPFPQFQNVLVTGRDLRNVHLLRPKLLQNLNRTPHRPSLQQFEG